VAYYIGRRLCDQPGGHITRGALHAGERFAYPGLILCREQYRCRELAEAEALLHWPDGAGMVIEAKNAKQAPSLLGAGLPRPPGVFGRLLMPLRMWRQKRIRGRGGPSNGNSPFDCGSREPRRPSPGGLSASVALRPPDAAPD